MQNERNLLRLGGIGRRLRLRGENNMHITEASNITKAERDQAHLYFFFTVFIRILSFPTMIPYAYHIYQH